MSNPGTDANMDPSKRIFTQSLHKSQNDVDTALLHKQIQIYQSVVHRITFKLILSESPESVNVDSGF